MTHPHVRRVTSLALPWCVVEYFLTHAPAKVVVCSPTKPRLDEMFKRIESMIKGDRALTWRLVAFDAPRITMRERPHDWFITGRVAHDIDTVAGMIAENVMYAFDGEASAEVMAPAMAHVECCDDVRVVMS